MITPKSNPKEHNSVFKTLHKLQFLLKTFAVFAQVSQHIAQILATNYYSGGLEPETWNDGLLCCTLGYNQDRISNSNIYFQFLSIKRAYINREYK